MLNKSRSGSLNISCLLLDFYYPPNKTFFHVKSSLQPSLPWPGLPSNENGRVRPCSLRIVYFPPPSSSLCWVGSFVHCILAGSYNALTALCFLWPRKENQSRSTLQLASHLVHLISIEAGDRFIHLTLVATASFCDEYAWFWERCQVYTRVGLASLKIKLAFMSSSLTYG